MLVQVRTALKDETDTNEAQTYLDSDGTIDNDNNRTGPQTYTNVSDGLWHMYTLTSHPDLSPGCAACPLLPESGLDDQQHLLALNYMQNCDK